MSRKTIDCYGCINWIINKTTDYRKHSLPCRIFKEPRFMFVNGRNRRLITTISKNGIFNEINNNEKFPTTIKNNGEQYYYTKILSLKRKF